MLVFIQKEKALTNDNWSEPFIHIINFYPMWIIVVYHI